MPGLLKLSNVKKSYDEPVVDGSFEMNRGEQVALVGPSGSGKSTLLHLISGILRPDSGSITLQDQEITQLSEAALDRFRAQKIGYVFQSFHLLEGLTVLENVETAITFAGESDYPRARRILCEMGLGDRLGFFPGQLSVGQKQRVAVARAVVNAPPLVLADEPTANLDPPRAKDVLSLIRDTCTKSGAALLVVSHDRETLTGFDRVIDYTEQFKQAPP